MEREHKAIGRVGLEPRIDYRARNGLEVTGIVVVVLHDVDRNARLHALGGFAYGIGHRARRRERALRVERQHHHARTACTRQLVKRTPDRRFAVAHGEAHRRGHAALVEARCELLRKVPMRGDERRALRRPDRAVLLEQRSGTGRQNAPMENEGPRQAGHRADARVHEKTFEVVLDRGNRQFIRRSRVDEQNPYLRHTRSLRSMVSASVP